MSEMIELTVDSVIEAWSSERNQMLETHPEAVHSSVLLTDSILKIIAEGNPATAQAVSQQANLPLAEVEEAFEQIKKRGGEFDGNDNLVGLALTLNPMPHRFRINGKELYTWCSLDAVFLPGLLETTAEVESTCPVTHQKIKLTITPEGVTEYSPSSTVLSITVPGISCRTDNDCSTEKKQTGPSSDGCSQMHFFSSRDAAEAWVKNRPGIAIFTVEEAYRLAYENWIKRKHDSFSKPI